MGFTLRTLLIWLVVLAMPVKAIAASTMLLCGPSHHRMQSVAHHPAVGPGVHGDHRDHAARHEHSGHEHHAGSTHHAHSSSHAQAEPAGTSLVGSVVSGTLTELGAFKCSACASCCSSVALPVSAPAAASHEPCSPPVVSASAPVRPFLTGGLERPPRTFLA